MNQRWIAAAAGGLVLLGGGILIGRNLGRGPSDAAPNPTATGSLSPTPTTAPTTRDTPPVVTGTPAPGGNTTVSARGKSVELTSASVRDLRSVRLSGSSLRFTANGEVTDSGGKRLGRGTLTARGSSIAVDGARLILQAHVLRPRQGDVLLVQAPTIDVGDAAKVAASTLEFTGNDGRPTTLTGPASITDAFSSSDISGSSIRWTNPPGTLRVAGSDRTSFSWSGQGTVRVAGVKPFTTSLGGVVFKQVDAAVKRGATISISATGSVFQVYVNGQPQLRTKGTVDLIRPVVEAGAGQRAWFTWAPRNLGGDYDMCMLRIRPLNAEARWVNLALDPMPEMYGGTSHAQVGGDTRGFARGGSFFSSAAAIDAIIIPATADREDISFDIPSDARRGVHHILISIEGNFTAIRADIEVRVS